MCYYGWGNDVGPAMYVSSENVGQVGNRWANDLTLSSAPIAAPAAPANLSASDGASPDHITLEWDASAGATSYKIFRAASNNSAAAAQIDISHTTSHNDFSAKAGAIYYYWVKASHSSGDSAFSAPDSGWKALPPHDFVFCKRIDWPSEFFLSRTHTSATPSTTFAQGEPIYFWYAFIDQNGYDFHGDMDNVFRITISGTTYSLRQNIDELPAGYYIYEESLCWGALQNLPPGSYTLTATLNDGNAATETNYANNTRAITFAISAAPPPANDDFANALPLAGANGSTTGASLGATKQPGEPDHCDIGGASVWWKWTAPAAGEYRFTTAGSSFDTMLAVYTGGSLATLAKIAENDDAGDGSGAHTSAAQFPASAGAVCHIAIDGWNAEAGAIHLAWKQIAPPEYEPWLAVRGLPDTSENYAKWLVNPADPGAIFRTSIEITDGAPIIEWEPDLQAARAYTIEGKTNLADNAWHTPTNSATRFFRVKVAAP